MHGSATTGKFITSSELKARWAYAEINSSRFGRALRRHLRRDIATKADRGVPFGQLPQREWPELVQALRTARPAHFVDLIETSGSEIYQSVDWGPAELLSCLTLPDLGGHQYYRFLALPVLADDTGKSRWDDPRHVSAGIANDPDYAVPDPIIAICQRDRHALLEGYLRSILWLRNPHNPLRVWIPRI